MAGVSWMFPRLRKRAKTALLTASAAVFLAAAVTPAAAQFDFLFGDWFRKKQAPEPLAPRAADPPAASSQAPVKPKQKKMKPKTLAPGQPAPGGNAPSTEAEGPPPPYEPDLLRLAEILGALSFLDDLCAADPPVDWRGKMQSLLETEARTKNRKERLAGSYNRGFRDYERSYRSCTPNAQAVIGRFLAEGGRISHEIVNRYRGS